MDAIKCLKERRSVRAYEKKEISKGIIKDIIDCARFAPTARNEQPWEFVVIKDKEVLQKLGGIAKNGFFMKDANTVIAVISKDAKYYLEDGSAAITYISLAAHAFGIGTCWIAGDKKDYCNEILSMLNAPEGHKLVGMVALGYAAEKAPEKSKRNVDEMLHWENF